MRNEKSIKRARAYRSDPTRAEARLWSVLRGRRLGMHKFRRQHAIGPYVVDFACVAAMLVVEVDGSSHSDPEQAAFDVKRTELLNRSGWRVLRISNADVLVALGEVEARIYDALKC